MQVRRLSAEDAQEFRRIRLEGLRFHPEAFGASFEDESVQSIEVAAERLTNSTVFGGFDADGSLCGVVGLRKKNTPKARHIATIWGMYITPSHRGSGLARRLLDMAVSDASLECRSIRLSVVASNEAAIALYKGCGFKEWAVDREALLVEGVFYDEVLMRLDLE